MGPKLQALLDYQDLELQIVDIRRQLERKERAVAAQQAKLDTYRQSLDAERDSIRKVQAEFDELDLDVKARSGHIAKLREHLNTVKTNKEYAAVLAQLNTEKADATRVETRAMDLMAAVDARKAAHAERVASEQPERDRLVALTADLEQTRKIFAARLNSVTALREVAAHSVAPDVLSQFQKLSERYDGEVMAEVVRPNPRRDEFVCGGCNISLRIDVANALRNKDELISCKSCGRILFLKAS